MIRSQKYEPALQIWTLNTQYSNMVVKDLKTKYRKLQMEFMYGTNLNQTVLKRKDYYRNQQPSILVSLEMITKTHLKKNLGYFYE